MTPTAQARRGSRAVLLMLLSLLLYTLADLGTKEWALDHLSVARLGEQPPVCEPNVRGYPEPQRLALSPRPLITGVLTLRYAENCGAAFSMLGNAPGWLRALVFGTATLGATVGLSLMFVRGAGGRSFAAAVPLILSGAIGNLFNRLHRGFVIDFIRVDPRLFEYPTFNVADIAIAVGAGLMVLDTFAKRHPPDERALSSQRPAPQA